MEYKNKITPNPLNSSGFINNNYKDENYATSDMDGEAHSEKYREINSNSSNGPIITAMERIHEDMYLPGLGELGIALQNITYINERITYVNTFSSQAYYAEPFNMSAKYMSSTLYYNNNIVNENYTNNATIDNIWSIDLNEAYITFSSIKYTEYNIMPMYKYVPTSTYMGGDEHIDTGDNTIEETEEPEIQPVEDEDERYTDSSYFCTNLNYRLSSYMFNYKSDNDISTLSANTYIRFSYIPTFYHHKFWPLQHIKKTITFNYVHDDIDRNDITITSDVDTNVNYKNSISITYNDIRYSPAGSSHSTLEREWYYNNSTSFTLDVKGSWIMYENNVSRGSNILEFTAEPGRKKFMSGVDNWDADEPHVKNGPWIFNSILSAYINYKDTITIYSKEITPPDASTTLKEWWCNNPTNFYLQITGEWDVYEHNQRKGTVVLTGIAPPGDNHIIGQMGGVKEPTGISGHQNLIKLISAYRIESIDYKDYLYIYYDSNTSQISQYSTTSGNVGGYQTIKTIYIKNNSTVTIDAEVKFYHTGNYTTTDTIRCNPGNTSTGRSSMWITYSQQGGGSTIGAEEGYSRAEIVSATKVDYDTNLHKKIYNYLINFCFIIPNFNYVDDNGIIFTVGTTKETDIVNSNPTINIYDTKIEMVFNGLGKTFTFYPKQNNMMNGCVIFTTEDDMYLNSTMLENSSQRLSVELNMYYKISNNYFNMFSTQYYFDVYELYGSGNKINNYNGKINFLKINNHKSLNSYINYTNLPTILLGNHNENKITNLTYIINDRIISNEYPGIRVNNLEQKYVSSYSYNGLTYTYNNSENYINTGFGISYISNFYNNGLQDLAQSPVMDFSYYYPDGNIDEYSYQGNTNIQITYGQYAPNDIHIYLRTFNQKDEYGIYNDCILNNLNGNINNPIDNSAIYFSDNMKIYNLPVCGAKQYITILGGPNYLKYYSLFDTHYLFIVNKKRYDITISFDDTSKILCRNKTNITIETGEMKLYYPMMSDLEYYINLSNSSTSSSDSITFQVIDLYKKLTKSSNSSTNVPGVTLEDKLMNMTATIYYLYTHQDEIDLTKVNYFYNLFDNWGINAFTEQPDGSRSCNIKIENYYTLLGRSYLVIIS